MTTAQTEARAVPLSECPISLFLASNGELCLKTEYGDNEGRIDAYIVSSGEFFWGGAKTRQDQRCVLVTPYDHTAALAAKDAEIAALKKEAADVVRPFAENAPPGNGEGPFELPDSHPITFRSDAPDTPSIVVGHFRAARSFLNKLERRDG